MRKTFEVRLFFHELSTSRGSFPWSISKAPESEFFLCGQQLMGRF